MSNPSAQQSSTASHCGSFHTLQRAVRKQLKRQRICHLHFQELFCITIKTSCLRGRHSYFSLNPELLCVHYNYKGGVLPGLPAECQVHTSIIYHFKQLGALATVSTCYSAISSLWLSCSNSHQPSEHFVRCNRHAGRKCNTLQLRSPKPAQVM